MMTPGSTTQIPSSPWHCPAKSGQRSGLPNSSEFFSRAWTTTGAEPSSPAESSRLDSALKRPNYKPLEEAGLLMALGLLSHRLPSRAMPGKALITSDWKTYARIGLGLVAVQKINRAFNWTPPPWLGALEAVAVINPLTLGFSVASAAQAIIMAPLVAGSVHLAMLLNQGIKPQLPPENKWAPVLSQVLTSIGFAAVGLKLYPKIVKSIAGQAAKARWMPKPIRAGLSQLSKEGAVAAGASGVMCSRGCSPGSIICLSEAAELLGGFGTWMKSHFALNSQEQTQ